MLNHALSVLDRCCQRALAVITQSLRCTDLLGRHQRSYAPVEIDEAMAKRFWIDSQQVLKVLWRKAWRIHLSAPIETRHAV